MDFFANAALQAAGEAALVKDEDATVSLPFSGASMQENLPSAFVSNSSTSANSRSAHSNGADTVASDVAATAAASVVAAAAAAEDADGEELELGLNGGMQPDGSIMCTCGRVFANGRALGGHRGKCKVPRIRLKGLKSGGGSPPPPQSRAPNQAQSLSGDTLAPRQILTRNVRPLVAFFYFLLSLPYAHPKH
jgi:hypothetical protein